MAQRGKTLAEGEKGMRETLRSWTGMNILRILLRIARSERYSRRFRVRLRVRA